MTWCFSTFTYIIINEGQNEFFHYDLCFFLFFPLIIVSIFRSVINIDHYCKTNNEPFYKYSRIFMLLVKMFILFCYRCGWRNLQFIFRIKYIKYFWNCIHFNENVYLLHCAIFEKWWYYIIFLNNNIEQLFLRNSIF